MHFYEFLNKIISMKLADNTSQIVYRFLNKLGVPVTKRYLVRKLKDS